LSRVRLRAYAAAAFPWICVKRYVLWPLRKRSWRSRVDDHVFLGGLLFPGDIDAIVREGVRAVISLCAEFDDPVERLAGVGIDHLHLPTRDMSPPSAGDLDRAVAFLSERTSRGERCYVHCASGVGRSATVAACYLVRKGTSPEDAFALLRRVRPAVAMRPSQMEAVRAFAARGGG